MIEQLEYGFPELNDSFLHGQDIFYGQFNDVEFYVEDQDQEHFYFNILKRLFLNLNFKKIFPLNGKDNVIKQAKLTLKNRSKIYIVDLDFDEILGLKEDLSNLFYLERYSIENHLITKNALYELIREKDSKLKDSDIDELINYNTILKTCKILLSDLTCTFILIKEHSLGVDFFGLNPARDFNLDNQEPSYKNNFISDYLMQVENSLKNVDKRFTIQSQIRKYKSNFSTYHKTLCNVPGKYLLNLIKHILERLKLINQISIESLTYKLSKDFKADELKYLYDAVNNFRA